jgi:hypothetical protein
MSSGRQSDANRQWSERYNIRTGARLPHYPEADGHPHSGSRRPLTHPNRHDRRVQETWWTNSYLPSTPPPSVAKGEAQGK